MISTGHIWLIAILLVIVLIIWGPGKLPDVGAGLGRAIREFRHASNETRDNVVNAMKDEPAQAQPAAPSEQQERAEPAAAAPGSDETKRPA